MSTKTMQAFEFDYTPPRRLSSRQKQCKHIWCDITHYHPDYPHMTIDDLGCQICGLIKDGWK